MADGRRPLRASPPQSYALWSPRHPVERIDGARQPARVPAVLAEGVVRIQMGDVELRHELVAGGKVVLGPLRGMRSEVRVAEQRDPRVRAEQLASRLQQMRDREVSEMLWIRPVVRHLPLIRLLLHDRGVEGRSSTEELRVSQQQLQARGPALAVADQEPGEIRVLLVDEAHD